VRPGVFCVHGYLLSEWSLNKMDKKGTGEEARLGLRLPRGRRSELILLPR
jgi:hypothetical protein